MANFFILTGRLTKKPELRWTKSEEPHAVTTIRLAVDRGWSGDTDFLNVTVWDKSAENCCTYLDKGSLIEVEGYIKEREVSTKEGKSFHCEIVATTVRFLSSKKKSDEGTPGDEQFAGPADIDEENPF